MIEKTYDNVKSFIKAVKDVYKKDWEKKLDDFEGVNIVAHYDVMINVLNELMRDRDYTLSNIELTDPMWNNYSDEFVMSIGSHKEIDVEELMRNGRYVHCGDGYMFIHEDCNSKILGLHKRSVIETFAIDDDDEDNDYNDFSKSDYKTVAKPEQKVEIDTDDDGEVIGFTKYTDDKDGYRSVSFYSNDTKLVERALKALM